MRIQDTLANVTALVPQIEKLMDNNRSNTEVFNFWYELLQDCYAFIDAEVERLKGVNTLEGENLAFLLEKDYRTGFALLTSNKEMIESFFTYVAKQNVIQGELRRDKLGVKIGKVCDRGEFYGKDYGFFATGLIRTDDYSKLFKVAAKYYGLNKAFKVSSKRSYNGATVRLTEKPNTFAPTSDLLGLVKGVKRIRRYGMGGDSYELTCDFKVCAN